MKKRSSKQKDVLILIMLVLLLLVLNYDWIDNALDSFLNSYESAFVDRVIDGDTIESNKTSIRLLGINSPERGEFYYNEAREFLEDQIFNKTVYLKYGKEKYDKYNRVLAYVFLDKTNINIKMVENGYANYYFYGGKDEYSDELLCAWENCMEKEINLCKPSTHACSPCISVSINKITNNCDFSCNLNKWVIKGEGRDKFVFNQTLSPNQEIGFELDLTNSGGSLFLRDEEGHLVAWIY